MKKSDDALRRISILMLTMALAVAMLPLTGSESYADEKEPDVSKALLGTEEKAEELTLGDGTAVDAEEIPAVPVVSGKGGKKPAGSSTVSWEDYNDADSYFGALNVSGTYDLIARGDSRTCEIETENLVKTYKFIPEESGSYFFYSSSENDSDDTYARIVEYDPIADTMRQMTVDSNNTDWYHFRAAFQAESGKEYYLQSRYYGSDTGSFDVTLEKDEYNASISVSFTKSTGKAVVKGTVTGDTFDSVYVDGSDAGSFSGASKTINMKNYDVGLHTIYATLTDHSGDEYRVYHSKAVQHTSMASLQTSTATTQQGRNISRSHTAAAHTSTTTAVIWRWITGRRAGNGRTAMAHSALPRP